MSNEIQIAFEVVATCHQRVVLTDDSYDEERLVAGLREGTILTTTWHDADNDSMLSIDDMESGKTIGYVVAQEMEGEYTDYR